MDHDHAARRREGEVAARVEDPPHGGRVPGLTIIVIITIMIIVIIVVIVIVTMLLLLTI